jgi:Uncharacterised nucleotidyltransferase
VSSPRFRELAPRDHLLLRAAVIPGAPGRAAWQEWFSGVVLDELPFDEARLLPRVFSNLATHGDAECLPPRLRGKYRWVWTSNQRRCHAVSPALQSLTDAGIPTMLLKGAALLATGRCAWGAREMGDVDILVPPGYEADAANVLDTTGWVAQSGVTPDFLARRLVPRRHGWNYARDAPHGHLDLHWHAFEGVRAPAVDAALFGNARRVDFGGVDLLALDDIDQVLHMIEHASHGEPAHRLMWIADIASVLARIDGKALVRRARRFDLRKLTSEALDIVATALGTPSTASIASMVTVGQPRPRERVLTYTETGMIRGRTFPRLSELVRAAAVHGTEARHPLQGARALLRRRIEPSLCTHPTLSAGLALFGRPRRIEVATLRVLGPLARPPAPCPLRPGEWLELTTASALDRVAGAGWSWPMPDGVWTDGAEARLALDISVPRSRPLALEFRFGENAHESPNARSIVLVNGRPLAEWRFDTEPEYTPRRLSIPGWLGDWCRPIDVAIRPRQVFMPANRRRAPGDMQPAVQLRAIRVVEG